MQAKAKAKTARDKAAKAAAAAAAAEDEAGPPQTDAESKAAADAAFDAEIAMALAQADAMSSRCVMLARGWIKVRGYIHAADWASFAPLSSNYRRRSPDSILFSWPSVHILSSWSEKAWLVLVCITIETCRAKVILRLVVIECVFKLIFSYFFGCWKHLRGPTPQRAFSMEQ